MCSTLGGLLFGRSLNISIDCNASNMTCSRIALVNTYFVQNFAGVSGSAIWTTDPHGVLVSCGPIKPHDDIIDRDGHSPLVFVHPKRLCPSWTGNRLARDAPGDVVGTYGRALSFSTSLENEVHVIGDVESGFVLKNVASGRQLPMILITVLDAYGNGPLPTLPPTLEATMTSPDGFVQGTILINITAGSGNFSNIVGFKRPGNYTLRIFPNTITLHEAEIVVEVRECRVGEEPTTNGELCQECDAVSYNFNPNEDGGCTPCPNDATCEGRYIIPKDGYWHKTPCHRSVKECLVEEACSYGTRQEKIINHPISSFMDCGFNESMLVEYRDILCRKGYEGLLCGSCNKSYGLTMGFKCSKCPHAFASALTLVFITLVLLAISSSTVRGGLPVTTKAIEEARSSVSDTAQMQATVEPSEGGVNLEMVRMMIEGRVPSAYFRPRQKPSTSTEPPLNQTDDIHITRWITAEILKVEALFFCVFYEFAQDSDQFSSSDCSSSFY